MLREILASAASIAFGAAFVAAPGVVRADPASTVLGAAATETAAASALKLIESDATIRARAHYAVLASLPTLERSEVSYDPKVMVRALVSRKFYLSPHMDLTLIGDKDVLVANVFDATLSLNPTGFARGGVFTLAAKF